MTDCIIEETIIKKEEGITQAERHIAFVRGEIPQPYDQAVRYKNTETDEYYLCLSGGFAWPNVKPGFAIVVAVLEPKAENPFFKLLEEKEDKNAKALVHHCWDLFKKYGENCKQIPWIWYTDPENNLIQFMAALNRKLAQKGEKEQFYTSPYAYKDINRFGTYRNIITTLLREKRLHHTACPNLVTYLQNINEQAVYKGSLEEHPAVAAFGYVISSLSQYEPWKSYDDRPIKLVSYEEHALRELDEQARYFEGIVDEMDEPIVEGEFIHDVD